jgi:hypothetical protein
VVKYVFNEINSSSPKHLFWIPINAILAFGLPLIFVSLLKIKPTTYYIILCIFALALIWSYVRVSKLRWGASLKTGWALGAIMCVFFSLAFLSLASSSPTSAQRGLLHFGSGDIIFHGLIFGLSSGIIISVMPFLVTWRALAGVNPGAWRKFGVALTALFSITLMSALYNLGASGLKSDDIANNIQKSMIASLPTLISGNPLATPISNIFLQVSENASSFNMNSSDNLQTAKSKNVSGGIN